MAIKIHIINKEDLAHLDSIDLVQTGLTRTDGMTISQFASNVKSTESTINFEIDIVKEQVPQIDEVEFCLTVRKKVNMTAIGVNGKTRKDIGEDLGKDNYRNNVPARPLDLPNGFTELYKG